MLSQIGGWDIFLPMISRDRILAVNEFRKGRPDEVKRITRAYAAAELAFPTLFIEGEVLFGVMYTYLLQLRREALKSGVQERIAVAKGLPNYIRMWEQYTGRPCPVKDLSQLVAKQFLKAAEGG